MQLHFYHRVMVAYVCILGNKRRNLRPFQKFVSGVPREVCMYVVRALQVLQQFQLRPFVLVLYVCTIL